ncbi:MAG: HEPN domain-containing protein [Thermoleophilia bacterium]
MTVDALLAEGRIEAVEPDPDTARERLRIARTHLATAALAADAGDLNGALSLLYDAARKAVAAHMLAVGYRPRARPGAHQAVTRYAAAVLGSGRHAAAVRQFDRMRRDRNRSEYESLWLERAAVDADLAHAVAIAEAVEDAWP